MSKKVLGNICFNKSILVNGYEYFSNYSGNGICRIKEGENQAELIDIFPDEKIDEVNLFSGIHYYNDNLFFVPSRASNIFIYNLKNGVFSKIRLNNEYQNHKYYKENHKFESSFLIGNNIYMFGCTFPAIVKLNMDTLEVIYIDIGIEGDFSKGFFYKGTIKENIIWCACMSFPVVLRFDTSDDSIKAINIETSNSGFSSIAFIDDCAYITGRGNNANAVVKYCINSNKCKDIIINEKNSANNPFGEIVRYDRRMFIFPEESKHIYFLNSDDKITICGELDSILEEGNSFIIGVQIKESSLEFFTTKNQQHHKYDLQKKITSSKEIELIADDEIRSRYLSKVIRNQRIICEGKYTIKDFISSI